MIGSGYTLAAAPLLPWSAIAALATVCAFVTGFGILRRARGLPWRAIALLILLAALVNPSVVEDRRSPQRDIAIIVVDESPSQRIGDRQRATEQALAALSDRLGRERDLDVRVVRAGKPQPGAGGEGDRRLVVEQAPSFGLVGKDLQLKIRVEDLPEGSPAKQQANGGQALVTLRKDGGPLRQVGVPVGRDVPMTMPIDHGGPNILELAVEPGSQELTLDNNRAVVVVNGVRDRLRVLLVSGEPHAGERVWRNILKSDPSVDLVHFTILRPPEKQDGTPIRELSLIAFPIRELFDVKLDEFDLIIFD